MLTGSTHKGWNRITTGINSEVEHGVAVRIDYNNANHLLNHHPGSDMPADSHHFLTSLEDWINITPDEQDWSICIDKTEFVNVLRRLALSSAALFFERFHKPIDQNSDEWNKAEYIYDFNLAIEHCCIPYGTLNKDYYFEEYFNIMHEESVRLFEQDTASFMADKKQRETSIS